MSWLLIVVAAVFAGFMIWGYKKGFLRVAYSLVAWLICILLVSWASPHVSNWVVENTEVDQKLEIRIEDMLRDKVESQDTEIQLPEVITNLIIGDKEAGKFMDTYGADYDIELVEGIEFRSNDFRDQTHVYKFGRKQ